MKWRVSAVLIVISAFVWIWSGNRGGRLEREKEPARQSRKTTSEIPRGILSDADGPSRTKSTEREALPPPASHSVQQLKDFILPAVAIQGVGLQEALEQVRAAYEETCRKTGESPLTLKFIVPPDRGRMLRVTLKGQNVSQSIRLLATLAGMQIVRNGTEYRFQEIPDDGKQVVKAFPVPPDFNRSLDALTGTAERVEIPSGDFVLPMPSAPAHASSIGATLAKLGLDLDPATVIELSPSGKLTMETTRAADAAALESLVKLIGETKPRQIKYTAKSVELPAGADWKLPDVSQLDDAEVQLMMRQLSQQEGANLQTMPSVTGRYGQVTTMDMRKDLVPDGGGTAISEPQQVGVYLDFQGDALGFGQNFTLNYENSEGGTDPTSGQAIIMQKTKMTWNGFSNDGRTMVWLTRRDDGSKELMMVTSTQIDATGRPVR